MHKYAPICLRSRRVKRNTVPLYDSTVWNKMKENERIEHKMLCVNEGQKKSDKIEHDSIVESIRTQMNILRNEKMFANDNKSQFNFQVIVIEH